MKPGNLAPLTDQEVVEFGAKVEQLMAEPTFLALIDLTELRVFEDWEKASTVVERENLWGALQGTRAILKRAEVAVQRMKSVLKRREEERRNRKPEQPEA